MKSLPVIQSPPSNASANSGAPAERRPLQTAEMVNEPARRAALMPEVVKALTSVFDPEIPVNIYDLGLIYDVIVDAGNNVGIRMTLTAPACPAAQFLPGQVKNAVAAVSGVADVKVDVVWEPPWTRDRMSDAARLQLGMF
jgi:FeS assembly SUF system protein